ncbi:MAG: pilus assembly protein [Bdellovibrionales bacterium]|nr:pilus assembly protein [Bdellovibrionales bacterium]
MSIARTIAHPAEDERGTVIVLFAIVLVPLLLAVGLAIDSGNLYRAQLAAQNAADATVLATMRNIVLAGQWQVEELAGARLGGSTPVALDVKAERMEEYLEERMVSLAKANMEAAGLGESLPKYPVNVYDISYVPAGAEGAEDGIVFRLSVTIERPVDLLLLDKVPYFGVEEGVVRATAHSKRETLNLFVAFDNSASMQCPQTGPCTCLQSGSAGSCPAGATRWDALIEGLKEFSKFFDLDHDHVVFVPFNLTASTFTVDDLRLRHGYDGELTSGIVDGYIEDLRNHLEPWDASNICDALTEGWAALDSDQPMHAVLFTDGAPSARRIHFTTDAVRAGGLQAHSLGFGGDSDYDYTFHSVGWLDFTVEPNVFRNGPSLLIPTAAAKSGGMTDDPAVPIERAACQSGLARAQPVAASSDIAEVGNDTFSPCVLSLESHLPAHPEIRFDRGIDAAGDDSWTFGDFAKTYYHCALMIGDHLIRRDDGRLHVIALGDPSGTPPSDLYGDSNDVFSRKDAFNARLALDSEQMQRYMQLQDEFGAFHAADFDFDGYERFGGSGATSAEKSGRYLPTHDATELRAMFAEIARETALRLIS